MQKENELIHCKNCGENFKGNYCNNCGQSSSIQRMNAKYLLHDFLYALIYFDRGLLYTVKELFTRPGHSIREYLQGKRVKHFKPISLLIILSTFYALLYHFFNVDIFLTNKNTNLTENGISSIKDYFDAHYVFTEVLFLPLISIASYIVFRKRGYNFIEHVVINSFLLIQVLCLKLVFLPLTYYSSVSKIDIHLTSIRMIVTISLMYWIYNQLFKAKYKLQTLVGVVLTYLIILIEFILYIFIIMLIKHLFT